MSTVDQEGVTDTIRSFIQSSVGVADLDGNSDLYESGLVNSLFAVQLVTFVERAFGVEVQSDDLDMENFRSLNATAAFVLRKNRRNDG